MSRIARTTARLTVLLAVLSLIPLVGTLGASAEPGAPAQAGRAPAEFGNRYIVVLDESVTRPGAVTDRLEAAEGFRTSLRYRHALEGFAARLSQGQVEALRRDPRVELVTPDRPVHATAMTALVAGDTAPSGVRRIEAATGGQVHGPSSVNVAVIDSGIDLAHPDLNAVDGKNCITTGSATDDNGHGTHVAGSLAARNNGGGVTGVAPGTRVFAVKVLDGTGGGSFSSIVCGIDWVTSTRTDADPANDISVANMSLGGTGSPVKTCATTTDAMHLAICRSVAAGVTYVVAAGNDGWDFDYASAPDVPASYPEVLTVTAVTDSDGVGGGVGGAPACRTSEVDDRYASFSNFAATSAGAAHTVAAPGTCISSTWPGGGHALSSGTSMASPHVAGLVALCIAEDGVAGACSGMAPSQIVQKVRSDAQAHASSAYGFAGDPTRAVTGRYYGHMAWTAAAPAPAPSPSPSPSPTPTTEPSPSPTPTTAPSPSPSPVLRSVSAAPSAVKILTGSLRSGTASRLATDDNYFYEVLSTSSGTRTSAWYGSFTGVTNALSGLQVTYKGKNTRSCAQTVAIWSWTSNTWVQLDARTVGTTEVQVQPIPSGDAAAYVSGTTGDGELRVRVRCEATGSFGSQGDLLRISYLRP